MSAFQTPGKSTDSDFRTDFAARPAFQAWEQLPLADSPGHFVWLWVKPPQMPQGLALRIPEETFRDYPQPETLTLRKLLELAGIQPSCVAMWYLYGTPCEGMQGTNPLLDRPIPMPAAGVDPNIFVYIQEPDLSPASPSQGQSPPSAAAKGTSSELFEKIEADWNAILQVEKQLSIMRKRLVTMSGKLQKLNRDLTPQERQYADRRDKSDWQDARRWLRDMSAPLSRFIKEQQIGDASSAGKRTWFEQIYQQYIVPRQPFDGLEQAHREFAGYRKMVQNLLSNMNNAHANAQQNGERRAQQVLNRIAAKIREAQVRKNMLGVMLD